MLNWMFPFFTHIVSLLRGLPKGSFLGMGLGYMKVFNIDGISVIDGHRTRHNSRIGYLIDECIRAVGVKGVQPPHRREK